MSQTKKGVIMKKLSITVSPEEAQKIPPELFDSIVAAIGVCYRHLLLGVDRFEPYGLGRILSGDTFLSSKVSECNRMTAFIRHVPIGVVVEIRFSRASKEVDLIMALYHRGYGQFYFDHGSFEPNEKDFFQKRLVDDPKMFQKLRKNCSVY